MTRRLKILWLSHMIPYPPKGGALQRSYNLVTELSKYHDVYLIAFARPNVYKQIFNSPDEGLSEATQYLQSICQQVKFISLPYSVKHFGTLRLLLRGMVSQNGYTINWLHSTEMHDLVNNWNKQYDFDCIHVDTISLIPYSYLLPNTPSTLDHHNIESDMLFTRTEKETNLFKKFYFWLEATKLQHYEEKHCHHFNANLTCSSLDSERLVKINPFVKEVVIPNGVDINFFQPLHATKKANSMVFAGGLSWYPNLDAMQFLAEKIWPLLKKEIPDVTMNIIGRNPSQKLLNTANRDDQFIVHGFVDDIRPYVAKCTIYLCPIRDGGGTKLKILDALAMGCAIVAHPMAIEGINLTHGENVLLASTPEEFVTQIITLTSDLALQNRLSENGRKIAVENFSYDNIGKKLADTFTTITQ